MLGWHHFNMEWTRTWLVQCLFTPINIPFLTCLKNGVPVFIVNICNIHEVVDKKKVNKTYMEEQQKVYSQVKDRPNAVVETAFVHIPISVTKWPKPWIIDQLRKDFEPD